jgi:uroporphyrinogen III methyltransferase/synthase
VIRWGTTPRQQTVTGTLSSIEQQVKAAGLKAPAIIVVGHVVSLRKTMKWFENRPLLGKRIVITRAREQASELVQRLTGLGAECLEIPTIEVIPPDDFTSLDKAIDRLAVYDWLIFTSVNGVNFFFDRLFAQGLDVRSLHHLQTAVIGPATAKRLFDFGIKSDIVPQSYRAESVVEAFGSLNIKGKKILLPRAAEARPILPVELSRMGAVVDEITSYHTRKVYDNADFLLQRLKERSIDIITFTSSSTVKNFHALIPPQEFERLMANVTIASIGPITADSARKLGFDVHIVADSFTIPGLCEALLRHYGSR